MPRRRSEIAQRTIIERPTENREALVKSASRVFHILELFDTIRMELTAVVIAAMTGIPQSSTSSLLRTMVALGYLDYDVQRRTYLPNNRVSLLGSWVDPYFVREGPVVGMMKEISSAVGENVVLVTPNGLLVQVVHVIPSAKSGQPVIAISSAGSILRTASGRALLSLMPDEEIARLVRRQNARRDQSAAAIDLRDLLDQVARTRTNGYALQINRAARDGWVISMPLPVFRTGKLFAVGVGDFSTEMTVDVDTVLAVTGKAIWNWLGAGSQPGVDGDR